MSVVQKIPDRLLRLHRIVPVHEDETQIFVQVDGQLSKYAQDYLDYLSQKYHKYVVQIPAKRDDLERNLSHYLGDTIVQNRSKTPLQKTFYEICKDAYLQNSSDIHFEPHRGGIEVFFRVQGRRVFYKHFDRSYQSIFANYIKLNAQMDIGNARIPQDGHLTITLSNQQIHFRVSSLPSLHGESFVLRLLTSDRFNILNDPTVKNRFQAILSQSQGLWLITGPIGNGKTTTYYALLNALNQQKERVVSFEDPIEIQQKMFPQIDLHAFPSSHILRYCLRQSIDVLGLGEIRTIDLLHNAMNAAIAGHCVLTTFHADSADNVYQRLKHLGIKAANQQSCLRGILHQRFQSRTQMHYQLVMQ